MTKVSHFRFSRRQALGMAATGAAGAAGLRLGMLRLGGGAGAIAATGTPGGAWKSPLGDPRARAAHLLRRAGFAYTSEDLDGAGRMSYGDLVDSVVEQKPQSPPDLAKKTDPTAVSTWWHLHMATTSAQFPERMLLFWHGLLTSDYRKTNGQPYIYQQNLMYRTEGTGDLRTLLTKTTLDPAMIRYLDLDRSTAKKPNENYSREVMELFTLGAGNFTENDVREGARAFSGIRISLYDRDGQKLKPPVRKDAASQQEYYDEINRLIAGGAVYRGELDSRQHDNGVKTLLGRTGNLDYQSAIDAILARPEAAVHIVRRALIHFALPDPPDALVNRIATEFRGSRYEIKTMMRSIFMAPEFTDGPNYRSLVRSPVDFVVAVMRVLNRQDFTAAAVTAGASMDQRLYDMPTVAGWPVNGGWLNSSSLLARLNLVQNVINAGKSLPDPGTAFRTHLDGVVGPSLAAVFNGSSSDSDRWYALLASPEFHLK